MELRWLTVILHPVSGVLYLLDWQPNQVEGTLLILVAAGNALKCFVIKMRSLRTHERALSAAIARAKSFDLILLLVIDSQRH